MRNTKSSTKAKPKGTIITELYAQEPTTHLSVELNVITRRRLNKPPLVSAIKSVFFPVGYPNTCSPDYITYQTFDTLQAFCSSLCGLISTRAILKGYGVGDSSSSAVAAALSWILKDGVSCTTSISFAYIVSTNLQADVKTWRFMADILNDTSILIQCIAVSLPQPYFLRLAPVTAALRACTGVAGGASKAALTAHFAVAGNTADLNAKEGSQETLVYLMGLIVGYYITQLFQHECEKADIECQRHQLGGMWVLSIALISLHLFFNYMAVSSIVLKTLNRQRARLLMRQFLASNTVLDCTQVAKRESILLPLILSDGIELGVSLSKQNDRVIKEVQQSKESIFILRTSSGKISVFLEQGQDPLDITMSYFTAMTMKMKALPRVEAENYLKEQTFALKLAEAGWDVSPASLGLQPYEFHRSMAPAAAKKLN
jgi:Vitamin B6 photo-protection and homoeostasis